MDQDDMREARSIYEVTKLTSPASQVRDDFIRTAVLAMFRDYIVRFKNPELALTSFMDQWGENLINQKNAEIQALTEEHDSMAEMLVGTGISDFEDMQEFSEEVDHYKELITESISSTFDPKE